MRQIGIALFALTLAASTSFAHYNMLLPDKPWANKGDKVTFTYQFGHPYEHELFDAPKPEALVLITPKGEKKTLEIDKTLTKIELPGADGKRVAGWRFDFTPTERGDHTFFLKTPKIKLEDAFVKDTIKVVLHVQTQNGWDAKVPAFKEFDDIHPYTRPYGLLPGTVFKGRFVHVIEGTESRGTGGNPDALVEIEKFNRKAPENLPPDELITFTAKTDDRSYFVATLPEPGWWGVTASFSAFESVESKTRVAYRTTMWIHVDEKK